RDLLDQQIIDVHGHKVVRVNDVDLVWETQAEDHRLRIAEVEVGMRGAVRRLLKGLPHTAVEAMAHRFQPRVIPWEFVDLIDRDPARRVRLKIEGDRLSSMHPSDIADILEELAPAEREAVFGSLDEEIAAEALEEVDPKLQRSLLEGMESSRVADIVEEMDPGAAADLLAELPEERSEAILHEMEPAERAEVEELLEFPEDWAAGRMTTEYVGVPEDSNVHDAIEALRNFEGDLDTVNEVFLLDDNGHLKGAVTLARLALSTSETKLLDVKEAHLHTCSIDAGSRAIAEQFDKYNLRSLAVLEHDGQLAGVIYPEHVIALLRAGH
ncbi:MAG: CBS domain-containing protein, partial [Terriglobus sp.]